MNSIVLNQIRLTVLKARLTDQKDIIFHKHTYMLLCAAAKHKLGTHPEYLADKLFVSIRRATELLEKTTWNENG